MRQTVVEKVAQRFLSRRRDAVSSNQPIRAGQYVELRPQHILTHDNSAPVMEAFATLGRDTLADPQQPVFALDHDIQNASDETRDKYQAIEAFASRHGIAFFPAGRGIGHQVMIEEGYVLPGSFVIASDSHANMYGALGAIGTPVVRSDAAAIWATGYCWWRVPPTVRVTFTGALRADATGKDVILTLCSQYASGEVRNAAIEFGGKGLESLGMEQRLTIANMTTEWGALTGWFPCDRITLDYLGRVVWPHLPPERRARLSPGVLASWAATPLASDPGASFVRELSLDLTTVVPQITGPNVVHRAMPISRLAPEEIRINKAYLVSCVNSRAGDLAAAARVLQGKKIADHVELYVAAASDRIEDEARASGDWEAILAAGGTPLPAGCGPCIGLGVGLLEAGEVGISSTNRNFRGRMGSTDAKCYLASPAVVAASAIAGFICGATAERGATEGRPPLATPSQQSDRPAQQLVESQAVRSPAVSSGSGTGAKSQSQTELLSGFPSSLAGPGLFINADHVDTDAIYSTQFTYRDGTTPAQMRGIVFNNFDPALAAKLQSCSFLVAGENFGCGSSREQAATALLHSGIELVIAASVAATFLRNALNNGLLCIEAPDWIEQLRTTPTQDSSNSRVHPLRGKIELDFLRNRVAWENTHGTFAPLDAIPQRLFLTRGLLNQVRKGDQIS